MKIMARLSVLAITASAALPASAQIISLDNVAPIPLSASTSIAAVSINPSSGNVTARSLIGGLTQCAGFEAPDNEKSVLGGNTGLEINDSGRIQLLMTPVDYFNRTVAQGRRVISLRVAQPLLCVDFAPVPSAAVNPVGLRITDPNNEVGAVLYGGISGFNFVTNGGGSSSFRVDASTQLACCAMLPAANASCFQGDNGGLGAGASVPYKGAGANLSVSLMGPASVMPGSTLAYSIVVSNTGPSGIAGVRVRDWYPKNTSGLVVNFSAGSWNCTPTAGASCGSTSGSGNIALSNVSLAPGSSVVLSVTRTLGAFAPLGSPYSVSAMAFAPPASNEVALVDNQAVLNGFAAVQELVFAAGFE